MAGNSMLKAWVIEALKANGGKASVLEVSQHIWMHHEPDLRAAGDLLYTSQYAMRWAAQALQLEGKLSKAGKNRSWFLTP